MSRARQTRHFPETRTNRAKAADPNLSIWVSANAGSGKTFVLTRRVLRLLLAGATPQSILCLTYTKAAAAEMRGRLARELARWATLPEPELVRELKEIEGNAYRPVLVERARTLFAQALETPGGLKIVTIHAFCESVLHRFPLEAGVPFDFKVIEDEERIQLLTQTREAVLAQGLRGEGATAAVETLFGLLSDFALGDAIELALGDGRKLKAVLADIPRAKANLRKLVGHGGESSAGLQRQLVEQSRLTAEGIREIVRLFGGDPSGNNRFVDLLARLDPDAIDGGTLRTAFLTDKGTARKLLTAKQQADRPDILTLLEAEQARVTALVDALSTALLVERSEALLDVVALIAGRYRAHKRARSLLDFDDLVEKLGDLLENPDAGPRVQYKLDTGIDHIPVDESRDTNPEQWRVVRAIADEFFNGAGDVTRLRSLFAVGDQKQSIYSFRGPSRPCSGQPASCSAAGPPKCRCPSCRCGCI
ncbi:UvrD-helicase domain-containing protein [Devosia sp. A8/3-2]|nr:UvrD-helicase domain-containing protein [Devosia sp. A8/3-2]